MAILTSVSHKKPLTKVNIQAFSDIEQLKRLIRIRRFGENFVLRTRTQLERETYIRLAIYTAKRARYNEKRFLRLGHEINLAFETPLLPLDAHAVICQAMSDNETLADVYTLKATLDISTEEYAGMLGTSLEGIDFQEMLTPVAVG